MLNCGNKTNFFFGETTLKNILGGKTWDFTNGIFWESTLEGCFVSWEPNPILWGRPIVELLLEDIPANQVWLPKGAHQKNTREQTIGTGAKQKTDPFLWPRTTRSCWTSTWHLSVRQGCRPWHFRRMKRRGWEFPGALLDYPIFCICCGVSSCDKPI